MRKTRPQRLNARLQPSGLRKGNSSSSLQLGALRGREQRTGVLEDYPPCLPAPTCSRLPGACVAAGTNTTSCTSSRGRSEFLAKITAGMAEAGGTETKQSQEQGASGLIDAICKEADRGPCPPNPDHLSGVRPLCSPPQESHASARAQKTSPPPLPSATFLVRSMVCPSPLLPPRRPQFGPGRHLLCLRSSLALIGQRLPGDQEAPLAPGAEPGQNTCRSAGCHQSVLASLLGNQRLFKSLPRSLSLGLKLPFIRPNKSWDKPTGS